LGLSATFHDVLRRKKTRETPVSQSKQRTVFKMQSAHRIEGDRRKIAISQSPWIKKRRNSQIVFEGKHTQQMRRNQLSENLLNYLNCAFGTLSFARPADKTLVNINRNRFSVFDFVDAYWTSVYTGFAPSTPVIIDHYFYHVYTSGKFDSNFPSKIKVFRSVNEFLHVSSAGFR
jgi:hypothetical protein